MRCYHGRILSVNRTDEVYEYLVEDGGYIVYVGNTLPRIYESAECVELGDGCLVPAFVDTHQHFASFATFHAGLNVMEARSNTEILAMVKKFAEESKEKNLIAFGASPYSVEERKLVTREELDSVCPDKEIMMVKYDGHACVVNSQLLNRMKEKVQNLRGYHEDTGEMNQEAFFAFSNDTSSSLSIPKLISNMQKAVDYEAAHGIGCVHTVSGVGFPMNLDIDMEKMVAKSLKNGFKLRVFPQSMDVSVAKKRKLPRIGGCFECALDGCFGSQDASMNEPYSMPNLEGVIDSGVLYYSDEKVTEFCKAANRAGLHIEMHAIGDKAFDQATRALKAALDDHPRMDHNHAIIHACLPTGEGLAICAEYGIQLPMQSAFINWRQEPDEYLEKLLGEERAARLNPLRTIADLGIKISFGSDGPCTDPDPIQWLARAVNHSNPAEAVTIREALRMATYNGCYLTGEHKERGSLEVGKLADMAILDRDLYEIPKEELAEVKVKGLILEGEPYRSAVSPLAATVWEGMTSSRRF